MEARNEATAFSSHTSSGTKAEVDEGGRELGADRVGDDESSIISLFTFSASTGHDDDPGTHSQSSLLLFSPSPPTFSSAYLVKRLWLV